MITKVTIELDAVSLAILQQALSALQLSAQATAASIQNQVAAQLKQADPTPGTGEMQPT